MRFNHALSTGLFLALTISCPAASPVRTLIDKHDAWFQSEDGRSVVTHVVAWQTEHGDWPKNQDTTIAPSDQERHSSRGTFDNQATTHELRFLAKAFAATKDLQAKQAFNKGLDHILDAQYANGGWPQRSPNASGYHRHVTFNDGTMIYLLEFLQDVVADDLYTLAGPERRKKAAKAIDQGIICILKCQVKVQGKLTVWCAQHDSETLAPADARSYELASLSGGESARILQFLMKLSSPSPEIIAAINAGAQWFDSVKLTGIRLEKRTEDRVLIEDPEAPPLWARFYDLETQRPFFCGRDGIKKATLAEIEQERRTGYSWYITSGTKVAEQFAAWQTP